MSTEIQNNGQSVTGKQPRLLSEFQYPTYEEWQEAAVKLLKGAPFEKKMYTKTYEGITLQPMYMQKDMEGVSYTDSMPGFAPYVRGNKTSGYKIEAWEVAQEIPYGTPEEFNKAIKHDKENGQTTVNMILDKAAQHGADPDNAQAGEVGKSGVSIATIDDLEKALDGIDLEKTPIFIQAGSAAVSIAALLASLLEKQGKSLEKLRGSISTDPLGTLAIEGTLPHSLETAYKKMAALTNWAKNSAPQIKTIAIQGSPYHNSGSSAVQELAFVIATGVEYLREMQKAGLSIDEIAQRIQFTFSLGTNYFMEIAKLRAARLVWAKIIKAFGGNDTSQKMTIHARTALWNKTIHDPYVNMLRTTVESFAGVVGGCESMHVGCFDEVVRIPDEFSRRISRNTHTILKEETHLNEIIDPAGGSWYVENLTDEIARKAWELFQNIEKQGGMTKALQAGFVQEQLKQTAEKRAANLSTRKDVFVGTNMFPNLGEKPLELRECDYETLQKNRSGDITNYRITQGADIESTLTEKLSKLLKTAPTGIMETAIEAVSSGATLGNVEKALHSAEEILPNVEAVNIHRGTEMFEALRAATEAYLAKTGSRPQIFMANMGPIPQHKARADFSVGFFEVGGFEMLKNDGFATADDAADAAIQSGAPAVIICSTDATYPELVPPLTQKIKAANPDTTIILAGYPKDSIEAFKEAGVDEFIHIRANLYQILVNLMKKLGILA